jgi:SAM-dependent methyltransferase
LAPSAPVSPPSSRFWSAVEVIDLARRATDPERLDAEVSAEEAIRSLGNLRFVNRWLGGRETLLGAITPLLDGRPRTSLLDVGCGSADLPGWLAEAHPGRLFTVGVDRKALHVRQSPPGVERVVADARDLPFAEESFDIVMASLFLHHFDEPELPRVLHGLFRVARHALVVNDLRRARVPYCFVRLVFPWLFHSPVSVSDGLVSIRRGFRQQELLRAFEQARIPDVRIVRRFPYRLLAVARKLPR